MRLFCSALFLISALCMNAQRELSFVEEYIDFTVASSGFETNGVYLFVNNTDKELHRGIRFPFAVSTDSIEVVQVYNLSYQKKIRFDVLHKGIMFAVNIQPRDTILVNINYRQTLSKRNVYILRSTEAWGEPLQTAKYSLTIEDGLKVEALSYPADDFSEGVYRWEKHDFMPDKDFEVVLEEY